MATSNRLLRDSSPDADPVLPVVDLDASLGAPDSKGEIFFVTDFKSIMGTPQLR